MTDDFTLPPESAITPEEWQQTPASGQARGKRGSRNCSLFQFENGAYAPCNAHHLWEAESFGRFSHATERCYLVCHLRSHLNRPQAEWPGHPANS